ncbi:A-kinase anchor protein 12 isoform X2 [Ascaphus truei]|uniref:A-kinase anchor protein 12 isoform X2 n=1 Tax=Ascaphus truei TaxID=8439 RepID=UPI003F5963CB
MGAGTSAEQVGGKSNGEEQEEQDGQVVEVDAAGDAKLLHNNGKIAIINGIAEEEVEFAVQAEDINGHQEEAPATDVGQQEPSNTTRNEEPADNMEVVSSDATPMDLITEDEQEAQAATRTTPVSDDKGESPEQASENLSNEVGFKKVFKFVGLKFTVKKEKAEKSEPVQLLNVKKDEVEVNGMDNHDKQSNADEIKPETEQETKEVNQQPEIADLVAPGVESVQEINGEKPLEKPKTEEEEEKEQKKSPESPTNPLVTETSSPFRKFFAQGWAGLRKKTSFRKSKEEDPQAVEKILKGEEPEKADTEEAVEQNKETDKNVIAEDQLVPKEANECINEESKASINEMVQASTEGASKPEEALSEVAEKLEMADNFLESVTEKIESSMEMDLESAAPVPSILSDENEKDVTEENIVTQIMEVIPAKRSPDADGAKEPIFVMTADTELSDTAKLVVEDRSLLLSSECTLMEKGPEAITTEAELLSSQEKAKLQGSPLRKLFTGSGLKKLSGKKHKGKKEEETKAEDVTEQVPVSLESREPAEVDGGDSSPSSPDESVETSPTENVMGDTALMVETEGEGATSDGERKKEGITPWASFKKMVTPKKRAKLPSESDKEDEVEKAKSATMSSTDSAGSVENQEEAKENGEEQKLEKSTEDKKKVDSSVSWEALICVGSSKKRARKTSDSDEEVQKTLEESQKTEGEAGQAKECESEDALAISQEKEQVQESPSPDQASSPTEGDGISTWQSFKRLVTPRRKSKTRVEDKIEEPAVVSNAEQSTSEGEAGKEETWVSLKKLIPGRKKKKSDGKQEQTQLNEPGQATNESEAVEEDYDVPAVVPLSEFDAAEQEKLDAQQLVEQASEKSSEGLIHAVTVTVIEGERAITSLEERSPSWISATVTETVEQAKEFEVSQTTEINESEVTVEENFIFSNVSQVMAETTGNSINEVELTSEALTALEEAIEVSCAEETTEMMSAVSQLSQSSATTEEVTPVLEDVESHQKEKKKQIDHILQEAAEKAKLSVDTLIATSTEIDAITRMSPSLESDVREYLLEQVTSLQETPCLLAKPELTGNEQIDAVLDTIESSKNLVEAHFISGKSTPPLGSTFESEPVQNETGSAEEKVVKIACTPESPQTFYEKYHESPQTFYEKYHESPQTFYEKYHESTPILTEENAGERVSAISEAQTEDGIHILAEDIAEESAAVLAEDQAEKSAPMEAEEQPQESAPMLTEEQPQSSLVVAEEQPQESAPMLTEEQSQSSPVVAEVQLHESAPVLTEQQPQESAPVAAEALPQESASVVAEAQPQESASVVAEELPQESDPVPTEEQPQESAPVVAEAQPQSAPVRTEELPQSAPVVAEEQLQDSAPVVAEEQPQESAPVLIEEQPQESAPVVAEAQPQESAPVRTEEQPQESAPVVAEEQPQESAPVVAEEQPQESAAVVAEEQPQESAPVVAEEQPQESAPVVAEMQPQESAPVVAEVQPQSAPVVAEVQPQGSAPVVAEAQPQESDPVLTEEQPQESAPVVAEVQLHESAPLVAEEQPQESAPVVAEEQPQESAPVVAEVQPQESAPVVAEVQPQSAPVVAEVQPQESAPVVAEVQPQESMREPEAPESTVVLIKEHAQKNIPLLTEQVVESTPVLSVLDSELEVIASVTENVPSLMDHALGSTFALADHSKESVPETQGSISRLVTFDVSRDCEVEIQKENEVEEKAKILKSALEVHQSLHSTSVAEVTAAGEEVVTTHIPVVESSEANKVSEPVTVAAVEEQVLAETVKPFETPAERLQLVQATVDSTVLGLVDHKAACESGQTVIESVSQKAAAIVDAAIEAATSCLVVDTTTNSGILENHSEAENNVVSVEEISFAKQVEDTFAVTVESHSTILVQKIIKTAVENVVSIAEDNQSSNVQESQSLESEHISEVKETATMSGLSTEEIMTTVEVEQDILQPPMAEQVFVDGPETTNMILSIEQVIKDPGCESAEVVGITVYREQMNATDVSEPQKEVLTATEEIPKENVKEELTPEEQKDDAWAILQDERMCKETPQPESESVQPPDVNEQVQKDTETVQTVEIQILQVESKASEEEKMQEVSLRKECSEERTTEKTQAVES